MNNDSKQNVRLCVFSGSGKVSAVLFDFTYINTFTTANVSLFQPQIKSRPT